MKRYQVEWSVGGRLQIPAENAEDARVLMGELLPPPPHDWVNIDVEEIT